MIKRIADQIPVQTGEWRGTTFDIIPKETFAMACRKINEIIDAVNELQESQNTYWADIAEIKKELQTRAENVPEPIKLYVCADGSVYDNFGVAKSHAVSIFNPLPAGATTTDRVRLERDLEIAKGQKQK